MKIIVRLRGGLGNQFFQYAVGRSLSDLHNGELLLDDSLLGRTSSGISPRHYGLEMYRIQARRLRNEERLNLQFRVLRPFRYLYALGLLKSSFIYYQEPHFEFDPNVFQLKGNVILSGFWQSHRYFTNIEDKVRQELKPIHTPPTEVSRLMNQIAKTNSVSLHIRRGDYVSCQKALDLFYICDATYYRRAVNMIAERVINPTFFIFSDDPDPISKSLQIGFPTVIVSRPQLSAHDDLRLMSHCNHHIIANSTFSWWGAWKNPDPNRIVVAPSRWFLIPTNTQDLIPNGWHTV